MRRALCLALVLALAASFAAGCGSSTSPAGGTPRSSATDSAPASTEPPAPPFVQENFAERRTINFASSVPVNNELLTAPVPEVAINFTKGLAAGSFIEVTRDGVPVTTGPNVLTPEAKTMYVPVNTGITGNYKVKYAAYFSSGYYEEGYFGFSVKLD